MMHECRSCIPPKEIKRARHRVLDLNRDTHQGCSAMEEQALRTLTARAPAPPVPGATPLETWGRAESAEPY